MTIFKVILSGNESIRVDETELQAVLKGIATRNPAIVCKYGIFNAAYYIGIVPDTKYMREVNDGITKHEEFESPFARILGAGENKKLT